MNDKNKLSFAEQQPELVKNLVQMLGIQALTSQTKVLDIIGDLIAISDAMCSKLVQDQELKLIANLQKILVYGDTDHKIRGFWMLCNIICNSLDETLIVVSSGIVSNISTNLKSQVARVRKESL